MSAEHKHADSSEVRAKKDLKWNEQKPLMLDLKEAGAKNFFSVEKMPEVRSAFLKQKDVATCMDEGTAHMAETAIDPEHSDLAAEYYLAGSGVLYPADNWDERLTRVAELLLSKGVRMVTSHEGCGAAGIAHKRDEVDAKAMTPDAYGQKWSKELADRMNEIKTEKNFSADVVYKHITGEQMTRPKEFHVARVAYVDATGQFNPDELENKETGKKVAPMGFVIDWGNNAKFAETEAEKNYPFAELAVAINIAFGDHGFGDKFTPTDPFVLVVIGKDSAELGKLKRAIEEKVISKLSPEIKPRVKVDGFVKP